MLHDTDLYRIIWNTRPLLRLIEASVEKELEGSGLTVTSRAVLEILACSGAIAVPAVARSLQIERQYVQIMVNEALAAGLIERRENPAHKRSPLLVLTEAGEAYLQNIAAIEAKNLESISRRLEPTDIAASLRVQEVLIEELRKLSGKE